MIEQHMSRRAIMRKTKQVALLTITSRLLAIVRAFFQVRFLGMSGLSDAFLAAFRIPNFLRKIFAEGALSAAFVPVFVDLIKNDKRGQAHSLMSYMFLLVQGLLGAATVFVWWHPAAAIYVVAPGFGAVQVAQAIPLVRTLFPFILFISSSALFAGALQAVNCFTVAAFAPTLLNVLFISALAVCTACGYTPTAFAWFIVLSGAMHLLLHTVYYVAYSFSFGPLTKGARTLLGTVVKRFGPALLGLSVLELNAVIDGMFASYLAPGSVTILHYGYRFTGIPVGVFGVAFSTVMLSHFARTSSYARARFSYYVIEAAKLTALMMVPATIAMWFLAPVIFKTFLWGKADAARVMTAAWGLRVYMLGALFFCFNRVLMSLAYALHNSWLPMAVTLGATTLNVIGNVIALQCGSYTGIAFSTVISTGIATTFFMLAILNQYHAIRFNSMRLWKGCGVVALCAVVPLCILGLYNTALLSFGQQLLSPSLLYFPSTLHPVVTLVQHWIVQGVILGGAGWLFFVSVARSNHWFYFW